MAENLNKKTAEEGHNRSPEFIAEKVIELAAALIEPTKRKDDANNDIISLHRNFRTKTGMTKADFSFAQRLAGIENEEEQDEKMLNMKIAFNALCPNKQLDFISLMDEEKAEEEKAETLSDDAAFEAQEDKAITVEEAEAAYGDGDDNKPSTFAEDDESVVVGDETASDEGEDDEAGDEAIDYPETEGDDGIIVEGETEEGGEDAA